ncbi:trypsin-like serine protease [Hyalangium sp.]|uniref:trypsin-like serine protease n=1 Tax=Hyalangium sp. TaxID=2028555 RepID=UPI002D69FF10|nr:trypsin-like serine protease [Hyalangium sp.]HYH97156.1 trypsin-like serine protease [Hyalangium sp.]
MSESILDTANRYQAAVKVVARFKGKAGTLFHTCSGVVVHDRLVMTAGHCVCRRRKAPSPEGEERFVVDQSTCARRASVQTFFFKTLDEEEQERITNPAQWPTSGEVYVGEVRPNPQLMVVYTSETNNHELASNADLAFIFLDVSLKGKVDSARLPREQIKVNEPIRMVGFGATKPGEPPAGIRRVGANTVVSVEEGAGRIFRVTKPLLIQPAFVQGEPLFMREDGSYVLAGDSGGPSFREEEDGTFSLVGIAKTAYNLPVEYSEYTSTYAYRDWIVREIEGARKRGGTD